MGRKVYARVNNNEWDDFGDGWLEEDCAYHGILFGGNSDYPEFWCLAYKDSINTVFDTYKEFYEALENAYDYYDDLKECSIRGSWYGNNYKNITEIVHTYLSPIHKKRYSTKEIAKWKELLDYDMYRDRDEDDYICEVLSLRTGMKYVHQTIYGYNQNDWQTMFYPYDLDDYTIKYYECVYMGTGVDVTIHDEPNIPQSADEVYGYGSYFVGDNLRQEIANIEKVAYDDVVLWEIVNSKLISYWTHEYRLAS